MCCLVLQDKTIEKDPYAFPWVTEIDPIAASLTNPTQNGYIWRDKIPVRLKQVTTENTAESQTLMTLIELETSKTTFKKNCTLSSSPLLPKGYLGCIWSLDPSFLMCIINISVSFSLFSIVLPPATPGATFRAGSVSTYICILKVPSTYIGEQTSTFLLKWPVTNFKIQPAELVILSSSSDWFDKFFYLMKFFWHHVNLLIIEIAAKKNI